MEPFLSKLKKPRALVLAGCFSALLWLALSAYQEGFFRLGFGGSGHPAIDRIIKAQSSPNDALSPLVVLPDDGTAAVVSMISGAERSVDLVMYSLNDKTVQSALAAAEARGVAVRVILNGGYQGQEPPTKKSTVTFDWLSAHGVPVRWSQPYFDLTHQKTLVIDGSSALIMTGNLDRTYYKNDRDFQIADGDAPDVSAIEAAFESDWNGTAVPAGDGDDLVWSPGSEPELVALIESAKDSLLVENEEMADIAVENALEDAARRG